MTSFTHDIYDKEHAENFEKVFVATRWGQYKLDLLAELVSHQFNIHSGQTLLEIGSGTGDLALRLAKILGNNEVTCLDISRAMIDIAQTKTDDGRVSIKFIIGDALNLPLKSATFDIVLERNISPLLYEQSWNDGVAQKLLLEMKRCSRNLVVILHQNKCITTRQYQYKRYTKNELARRLEEIGLHQVKCSYVTYSIPSVLEFLGEGRMKKLERVMATIPFINTLGGSIIASGYV